MVMNDDLDIALRISLSQQAFDILWFFKRFTSPKILSQKETLSLFLPIRQPDLIVMSHLYYGPN